MSIRFRANLLITGCCAAENPFIYYKHLLENVRYNSLPGVLVPSIPSRARATQQPSWCHGRSGGSAVVYPVATDNCAGPLTNRLNAMNRPVTRSQNGFSTPSPSFVAGI